MKLSDMFVKSIDRPINGVIKVMQTDDENRQQELEEYVITRELRKHFSSFYDHYEQSVDGLTDKMGVWISGFFGSGKSHFLKILSYLLANEEVGGKTAAPDFTNLYVTGEGYYIPSPRVPGYTADISVVQGVMEEADVVYDVIYTANVYTLTIHYVYEDGRTAAPDYIEVLHAGDMYDVASPVISGYQPNKKVVAGEMPARDVTFTVIYKALGDDYTIIDDYGNPLGLGNVNLNAGDCFE